MNLGKEMVGALTEFVHAPHKVRWLQLKVHMLARKLKIVKGASDLKGYLQMQKSQYELAASIAKVSPGQVRGDYVAALDWDEQNRYPDYETYILKYVPKSGTWVALEYGCGPGRNLRNWNRHFQRIDGVDISANNLKNAKAYCMDLVADRQPRLFLTDGAGVAEAANASYDFCFSVICLQHICSHDVRSNIFTSLFAALKPGGRLAFQMGFSPEPINRTVGYQENYFQAPVTNGGCDVRVESEDQLHQDLAAIGFQNIECTVRPVLEPIRGIFPQWIFVNAQKPF